MNYLIEKMVLPVTMIEQSKSEVPKKPEEVISFRGAQNVSKWFYDSVHHRVREGMPLVQEFPLSTFTAKQLCGEDIWGTSAKRQRLIGKCLANAVDEGLLPLTIINRKRYPLKYRMK